MADALEFYDGGAFADCFFVQYPGGLGLKPASHGAIKMTSMTPPAPSPSTGHQPAHSPTASTALTLHAPPASATPLAGRDHGVAVAETAARTREALELTLKAAATSSSSSPGLVNKRGRLTNVLDKAADAEAALAEESAFDGSQIALHKIERKNNIGKNVASNVRDLVIAIPGSGTDESTATTAPIVRSPTKTRKIATSFSSSSSSGGGGALTTATTTSGDGATDEMFSSDKGKDVVVPFCVSNWRNKKNLLVPLAVRVAQHAHAMGDTTAETLGDAIIDLATSMQEASREVEVEMQAKERAREEEEERRQAALEAEEAERAKQLLQQNAERQQASFQRRETREQRLERIRLERELRELEKKEKQRQRLLEKAAARLNISVEALEADETLLRAVEASGTGASAHTVSVKSERLGEAGFEAYPSLHKGTSSSGAQGEDDGDDEFGTTRLQRGGLKGSVIDVPVVSNEGILREMAALQKAEEEAAALRALQPPPPQPSSARAGTKTARQASSSSSDEDNASGDEMDGLEVGALMNKKRRRL